MPFIIQCLAWTWRGLLTGRYAGTVMPRGSRREWWWSQAGDDKRKSKQIKARINSGWVRHSVTPCSLIIPRRVRSHIVLTEAVIVENVLCTTGLPYKLQHLCPVPKRRICFRAATLSRQELCPDCHKTSFNYSIYTMLHREFRLTCRINAQKVANIHRCANTCDSALNSRYNMNVWRFPPTKCMLNVYSSYIWCQHFYYTYYETFRLHVFYSAAERTL